MLGHGACKAGFKRCAGGFLLAPPNKSATRRAVECCPSAELAV